MSTRQHVTHPVDVCGSEKALTRAVSSGKSVLPGSERVRIATLAVIAAAKGRSLALSKADQRALAAMAIVDAADIVAHPEREAEIRARVERVTVEMIMAARASRSGRRAA